MPLDAERALTAALLARLRADAGVAASGIGPRVHDQPPADPGYPYLVLGRCDARPFGGGGGDGEAAEGLEIALTLTCVSRFQGTEEAKGVNAAVRACLHDAGLPLTDWALVNLRVVFSDVFRASDWRSTYGVVRLRAVVEPNEG